MPWGFSLPYKRSASTELATLRVSQDMPHDPRFEGVDSPAVIKNKAGRLALMEQFLPPEKRFVPPKGSVKKRIEEKSAQKSAQSAAEKEVAKAQHDGRLARAMAWEAIDPQFEEASAGQQGFSGKGSAEIDVAELTGDDLLNFDFSNKLAATDDLLGESALPVPLPIAI